MAQMALSFGGCDGAASSQSGVGIVPFKSQLLKWIGNKQRLAPSIIGWFPDRFGTYYEPFLGSGGVLGVLSPRRAEASDAYSPLIEIWTCLQSNPRLLVSWYAKRLDLVSQMGKSAAYAHVLSNFNKEPNGADLLFLSRTCYGGVIRFRKADGFMSTPCGAHEPMSVSAFAARAEEWSRRVSGTTFRSRDYREAFDQAGAGDLIYCDPPYVDSQAILYGAQAFRLQELYEEIAAARARGVYIALSIDGTKKSGKRSCGVSPPSYLFKRRVDVSVGRSMLRRFQMSGESLEAEEVVDRLYLTF